MTRLPRRVVLLSLAALSMAACEQVKSSNPLSPLIAGPIAGVNIDAPGVVAPAPAAQIPFPQQPISLVVSNANSSGVRPVSYVFEISIDPTFAANAFRQTGVAPGGDGTTSFRMPEMLPADRTYFWRAMADDGANSSEYSATATFRVFTPVVIQPPGLRDPGEGATVATRQPTLSVNNSTRTGPAGTIQYLFEVATDASMGNKVASSLVTETAGTTSFTVPNDLATATRFFWRAKAIDGNDSKNQSDYSGIRSFLTPAAPVTQPNNPQPPSGVSIATDHINMGQATILNSPLNLGSWPATSAITALYMRPSGIEIDFSKRDGPGRWPDVRPPGWDGDLQYTLGMCLNIGRWYCSATVQFWHGLKESGGEPWNYAMNWFYDPSRWAPMTGHQPAVGETIGIFVCAGDCRNNTRGDLSPVKERTNVVLVPMPGSGGATYRF